MVIQKWLQVQDVLLPMVVIGVVANLANIGFNLIFIHLFGFNGCPVATSVSRLFQLAAAAVYLKFYGPSHPVQFHLTMSEPDKLPCYSGILQYLILGLPSGVMTAMEAWSFELTTIVVAAFETTADVDAHIIMLNICGFTFLSFP